MSKYLPLSEAQRVAIIEGDARRLVNDAQRLGVRVVIRLRPLKPLRMGHAEHSIEVRPVRK